MKFYKFLKQCRNLKTWNFFWKFLELWKVWKYILEFWKSLKNYENFENLENSENSGSSENYEDSKKAKRPKITRTIQPIPWPCRNAAGKKSKKNLTDFFDRFGQPNAHRNNIFAIAVLLSADLLRLVFDKRNFTCFHLIQANFKANPQKFC